MKALLLLIVAFALALASAAPAAAQERPTALLAGDSMMDVLQRHLAPELEQRGFAPRVDARVGSGLTKPEVVDWRKLARRQARTLRPAVTIVFLGAGDIFDFRGIARCCKKPWVAAYARRIRAMARSYGRHGQVYWLTLPAPRHRDLQRIHRAVNRAIRRARVPTIDLVRVFSHDGKYHRQRRWGGVLRTARASDGVHLSAWGSLMASAVISDAVEEAFLLRATGR